MFSLLFCLLAQCSCETQVLWKSCSNCVLQILLLHAYAALVCLLFFILLKHIKTDLIFLLSKTLFLYYHKTDLIFYKSKNLFFFKFLKIDLMFFKNHKTLFYVIKTYLNSYHQKPLFPHTTKQIQYFDKSKSFFLPIKIDLNFFNKRRDFFHK